MKVRTTVRAGAGSSMDPNGAGERNGSERQPASVRNNCEDSGGKS